jgi:malonyl-CoA decarboxylase
VAEDLHAELPNLKVFVTLSPVPGLRAWARSELAKPRKDAELEGLRQRLLAAIDGDGAPPGALREPFEGLAAWYLTREWREGNILDPVARFHLGNGARLERINFNADPSVKGLTQSFGTMVNYVYDLDDVEKNHEEYFTRHHAARSSGVERLVNLIEPLMVERA